MLGERSDQRGPWEADQLYLDLVGKDTFYGLLASLRGRLFRDADFAELYCPDNGRVSVPPSLLATALLLQAHDKVSDAEAKLGSRTSRGRSPLMQGSSPTGGLSSPVANNVPANPEHETANRVLTPSRRCK